MSKSKYFDKICIFFMIVALVITALFMNGEKLGMTLVIDEDSESHSDDSNFTTNDLDGDWDTTDATVITLSGDSGTVSGSGAYFYDGDLVITTSGTYVISGELTDGSIVVDSNDNSKIWILLDGVTVTNSEGPGILVENADKVFLTLEEDTENYITSTYISDDTDDETSGDAIFTHDDLTINGSGSLVLYSENECGIDANDDLVITGGTITIDSPDDGIHVNDSFRFCEADLTITTDDDAIHSDTSIYISSGTILVNSCYEGLEALYIDIVGGDITIYATDDGINANGGSSETTMGGGMMNGGGQAGGDLAQMGEMSEITDATETSTETSTEATDMSTSNSDITITLDETDSESMTSNESTSDTDDTEDSEDEEELSYVNISGGTVTIINENGTDADGIDSNGDIIISGGTVYVSLSGSGGNAALDYGSENNGTLTINGGTVIAAGGSMMLEDVNDESTQASITYILDDTEDNTTVSVYDSDMNEVISYTVPLDFSAITISTAELTVGETYTLVIGDTEEEITLEDTVYSNSSSTGMSMDGGMAGGGMGFMSLDSATETTESTETVDTTEVEETTETTEATETTETFAQGEMPEMGEMTEGEMPEMSEMAQGEMPQGGMPGMESDTTETEDTSVGTSLSEATSDYWIMLISSGAVLIIALVIAISFKRRR